MSIKRLLGLAAVLSLTLLPARAPAQQAVPAPAAPARAQEDGSALQPGDVLRLLIWRQPDMSGDFMVDETGMVTLPMLGPRRAAGIPITQLRAALVSEFQQQLRTPSITVTPLRRINVLGEVNKPGVYPVDLTVTLSEVIAMAGGVNPQGDVRKISVVGKDGRVITRRIGPDATLTETGIRSGDQVLVGSRSWLERNSAQVFATGVSIAASVLTAIILTRR